MVKIYSGALEFANWNTGRQKPSSISKEKDKLKLHIVRNKSSRIISSSFLALGLAQDCYQSDVRQSGWWKVGVRMSDRVWWSG